MLPLLDTRLCYSFCIKLRRSRFFLCLIAILSVTLHDYYKSLLRFQLMGKILTIGYRSRQFSPLLFVLVYKLCMHALTITCGDYVIHSLGSTINIYWFGFTACARALCCSYASSYATCFLLLTQLPTACEARLDAALLLFPHGGGEVAYARGIRRRRKPYYLKCCWLTLTLGPIR